MAEPSSAYIHAMIRRELARGVPAQHVVLGGFAQGAGLALRAALSFPDAALGGAVALSGFFGDPRAARSGRVGDFYCFPSFFIIFHRFCITLAWVLGASNARLPVLLCHGTKDDVVPFREGERAARLLEESLKGPVTFKEPLGGFWRRISCAPGLK